MGRLSTVTYCTLLSFLTFLVPQISQPSHSSTRKVLSRSSLEHVPMDHHHHRYSCDSNLRLLDVVMFSTDCPTKKTLIARTRLPPTTRYASPQHPPALCQPFAGQMPCPRLEAPTWPAKEDLDTTGGRGSRVHHGLAVVIGAGSLVVEVAKALLAGQAQQWVMSYTANRQTAKRRVKHTQDCGGENSVVNTRVIKRQHRAKGHLGTMASSSVFSVLHFSSPPLQERQPNAEIT